MNDRQELNRNLAQMLKGGVIMDVMTPDQAKIAETAGPGHHLCRARCRSAFSIKWCANGRPLAQHHRFHLASRTDALTRKMVYYRP